LPAGWNGSVQQQATSLRLWINNPSVPELEPVAVGSTARIEAGGWRWTRDATIEGALEVAGRLTHRPQDRFDDNTGEPEPAYLKLADTGRLHVMAGGRFTNRSDALMQGMLVVDGELQNRDGASLRIERGLQLAGRLHNEGSLQFTFGSGVELASGAAARLGGHVDNGALWRNLGKVEVTGRIENLGGFDLRPGSVLHMAAGAHFDNVEWGEGWVFASAGSTVRVDGRLSGREDVAGLTLQGGALVGQGRVEGFTRVAGGELRPGGEEREVGTLTLAGRVDLQSARLTFDLRDGASDFIDASGAVVTMDDGRLDLQLLFGDGAPAAGRQWTLLTTAAGSWLDTARIDVLPQVPAFGGGWTVWRPDTALLTTTLRFEAGVLSYHVTAVPEPQTWLMLALGLGALGAAARRRRGTQSTA
jgi:hypothetical protein